MKLRLRYVLIFFCILLGGSINAQSIIFSDDGGSPNNSAILELRSSNKGVLVPRMSESDRLNILSPAQGLLVFQTTGSIGFFYHNGTSWDTLGGATTVQHISNVTNISSSNIVVIRDQKASNTDGGTFTSGAWQTRDLNKIDGDLSFSSLGTNEFKLDSGTYVITITAPAFEVDEHQIRLFNKTNGTAEAVGSVAYSNKFAVSNSILTAVISVNTASNTFSVEHRCSIDKLTNGLGLGTSWGENVYTQVRIEKL